jgi:hypothetical protein
MRNVGHQRNAMASISILHDESYYGSRGNQLGITILTDEMAYLEHDVPSTTNFVAGGNMTKYWNCRRRRSPQNASVAIDKVMEMVTVPVFLAHATVGEPFDWNVPVGTGINSLSPGYSGEV